MDSYDDYLFNIFECLSTTHSLNYIIEDKTITDRQEINKKIKTLDTKSRLQVIDSTLDFLVKSNKITIPEMQQFKNSILTFKKITDIEKDIASLKDSQQNTTDIVNLFTDIDKNRINLEDQNKEINKRLEKLEETTNERFQKLENLIMLVLNKIEKS